MKHDRELVDYKHEIGKEEYEHQYRYLYQQAQRCKSRFSGQQYENSLERLQSLKEKYRDGVSVSVVSDMVTDLINRGMCI